MIKNHLFLLIVILFPIKILVAQNYCWKKVETKKGKEMRCTIELYKDSSRFKSFPIISNPKLVSATFFNDEFIIIHGFNQIGGKLVQFDIFRYKIKRRKLYLISSARQTYSSYTGRRPELYEDQLQIIGQQGVKITSWQIADVIKDSTMSEKEIEVALNQD